MISANLCRSLAWISGCAVLAFLVWTTFAPQGFPGAIVVVILMGGFTIAALRLGTSWPEGHWQTTHQPPQLPRVAILILFCLVLQTAAIAGTVLIPQFGVVSIAVASDVVWTASILIFLGAKYVALPQRRTRPGKLGFAMVAGLAITAIAAVAYIKVLADTGPRYDGPLAEIIMTVPRVAYAAAIEEIVFRVLLLTALVQACQSSKHALVLSSIIFALIHIPGAFAKPLILGDGSGVAYFLGIYPGLFTWQLGVGFALGALWLRTGSIILITVVHTIFNLPLLWLSGPGNYV